MADGAKSVTRLALKSNRLDNTIGKECCNEDLRLIDSWIFCGVSI